MIQAMPRRAALLRATTAALLAGAVLLGLDRPICSSAACPMAGTDRAICRAMGLDCCRTPAGRVSHGSPQVAAPDLATPLLALWTATPPAIAAGRHPCRLAPAAPAVVQGVGLHTLLAVFRL
jgi:hypothetical protein